MKLPVRSREEIIKRMTEMVAEHMPGSPDGMVLRDALLLIELSRINNAQLRRRLDDVQKELDEEQGNYDVDEAIERNGNG